MDRLDEHERRISALERDNADLRAAITENTVLTREVLAILQASKWGAAAIRWCAAVAGGIAAAWAAVRYGRPLG